MNTGHFSGYTGDTLVHLANGSRKYMRDLAPGDELQLHNSETGAIITRIIQYEFDGFISLVAPGISTTKYTIYHDLTTGTDTTPIIANCRTLYYRGTIYNFSCQHTTYQKINEPNPVFIMGTAPSLSQIGTYDIYKHPYGDELIRTIHEGTNTLSTQTIIYLAGLWADPPGQITQRHPKTASV